MEKKNISVAIVDDHPIIIDGLQNMLHNHKHIQILGVYSSGKALLEDLSRLQPDVLLLDIQLPDTTGDALVSIIQKKSPLTAILVLTSMNSTLYLENMLRQGVHGYLLKSSDSNMVIAAIEAVSQKQQFIDPVLKERQQHFTTKIQQKAVQKPSLTSREIEVLRLTVQGYSIKEISEKLFIGIRTVDYHRSNLLLKLDARNTAEMVRKALEQGLT
jgi:DNA-binding NarL/FixJ family response regulator